MSREIDAKIELLIEAMYPILYVVSSEEERVSRKIEAIAKTLNKTVLYWSCSQGIHDETAALDRGFLSKETRPDPGKALEEILTYTTERHTHKAGVIFVFKDFHHFMKDHQSGPFIVRQLRDVATQFRSTPDKTLLVLSPVLAIPPELEHDITIIDYPLPAQEELAEVWEEVWEEVARKQHEFEGTTQEEDGHALDSEELSSPYENLKPEEREDLFKAALGLTENEARNVFRKLHETGYPLPTPAPDFIAREKEQLIFKSGLLEYHASLEGFDSLGGLTELKSWLQKRANSFTERARQFGLPEPKGVLLLGVPGCGKSMCAKVVAAEWHKPLLRLDIGRIFGGLVGSSEENIRRAIKVAESVSPCILWIDEIEKGLAGIQGGGDSGVTARVFGSLLTWMQEKTKPVFVVATANDIRQLPPELLRKGRFDEIFFVDLPTEEERKAIFRVHIQKRQNPVNQLDKQAEQLQLQDFARHTDGFSGAEIEQVIIEALHEAHYLGAEEPIDYNAIILEVIRHTVPLSKAMQTTVAALQQWAETRARFASPKQTPATKAHPDGARPPASRLRVPFPFRSGERARTLPQLIDLCQRYPDEATEYLQHHQLETWLRQNGLPQLAEKAAEARQSAEQDFAWKHFLQEATVAAE